MFSGENFAKAAVARPAEKSNESMLGRRVGKGFVETLEGTFE
jgi:hypothetical protein